MTRSAYAILLAAGAASIAVTVALAGNGVGGVFNLGQVNTVNAVTQLRGATTTQELLVTNTSTANTASGVFGLANAGTGVFGQTSTWIGVRGAATAGSGVNFGVHGATSSPAGFAGYFRNGAVVSVPTAGRGIRVLGARGTDAMFPAGNYAGAGEFAGPNGVVGYATFVNGAGLAGFTGTIGGYGVYGATARRDALAGYFRNLASAADGQSSGIRALASGATDSPFAGFSGAGEFAGYNGVVGAGVGADGFGVLASKHLGRYALGAAGESFLSGNVQVIGNLSVSGTLAKGSGTFKIDHPLDPENRYLSHAFVESPDMKNIYDGVVVTDGQGRAVVELPDYFEALNRDPRYQLTAIGSFSPVQVAEEVSANRFVILSQEPGVKVSWQVTGIRRDAFAVQNPVKVEEDKALADRGRYLYPEAHGKPVSLAIGREEKLSQLVK